MCEHVSYNSFVGFHVEYFGNNSQYPHIEFTENLCRGRQSKITIKILLFLMVFSSFGSIVDILNHLS